MLSRRVGMRDKPKYFVGGGDVVPCDFCTVSLTVLKSADCALDIKLYSLV